MVDNLFAHVIIIFPDPEAENLKFSLACLIGVGKQNENTQYIVNCPTTATKWSLEVEPDLIKQNNRLLLSSTTNTYSFLNARLADSHISHRFARSSPSPSSLNLSCATRPFRYPTNNDARSGCKATWLPAGAKFISFLLNNVQKTSLVILVRVRKCSWFLYSLFPINIRRRESYSSSLWALS